MRKKKFKIIMCAFVLSLLIIYPVSAVVQSVKPMSQSLTFTNFILQDNLTGQQQSSTPTVDSSDANIWQYGSTRVFGTFNVNPDTSYSGRLISQPMSYADFQGMFHYKIIVNMYLTYKIENGVPEYYPNETNNIIYALHPDRTTSSAMAKVTTIENSNQGWIKYEYELIMNKYFTELWFNFGFDTSSITQRNTVITFFGNMQIDNLDNPQIGGLESTIIGNPDQTEPPEIEQIESDDNAINNQIDDAMANLREDFIQVNENFFAAFNSVIPAFSITRYVITTAMSPVPVTVLIYIVLTFGLVIYFMRIRK